MKPQIGITENHLANSVALLSSVLADGMTLYIKTKIPLECLWRKFHGDT
jgi:starvation-inducible DNA-binding protein